MKRVYLMVLLLTAVLAQEGAVDPDLFVRSDTPVKTPGMNHRGLRHCGRGSHELP